MHDYIKCTYIYIFFFNTFVQNIYRLNSEILKKKSVYVIIIRKYIASLCCSTYIIASITQQQLMIPTKFHQQWKL